MTMTEWLGVAAAILLGGLTGRLLDRSGFSFDRAFRAPALDGDAESLRGWLLGLSLLLLGAGALGAAGIEPVRPGPLGPVAAVLAGLVAGIAGAIIAADPLTVTHGAGRTRLPHVVALLGWVGGVAAGSAGALGQLVVWIGGAGPWEIREVRLSDLAGLPAWAVQLGVGALIAVRLLRVTVEVRPGRMEWPRTGTGIALGVAAGAALAVLGGESSGLNAVTAARTVIDAPMVGKLWLHPSLLVGCGLLLHGFMAALREGRLFPGLPGVPGSLAIRGAAGFMLGLACALAGGDPVSHACFGLPALSLGSAVFVLACGCGALLMGVFEWRLRGRPGAAPNRGHGV